MLSDPPNAMLLWEDLGRLTVETFLPLRGFRIIHGVHIKVALEVLYESQEEFLEARPDFVRYLKFSFVEEVPKVPSQVSFVKFDFILLLENALCLVPY